jgi:hypothetical protein
VENTSGVSMGFSLKNLRGILKWLGGQLKGQNLNVKVLRREKEEKRGCLGGKKGGEKGKR